MNKTAKDTNDIIARVNRFVEVQVTGEYDYRVEELTEGETIEDKRADWENYEVHGPFVKLTEAHYEALATRLSRYAELEGVAQPLKAKINADALRAITPDDALDVRQYPITVTVRQALAIHDALASLTSAWDGELVARPEWARVPRKIIGNGAGVQINLHLYDMGPFQHGDDVLVTIEPAAHTQEPKE